MQIVHDMLGFENDVPAMLPHVGDQGVGRHLVVDVEETGVAWLQRAEYQRVFPGEARVYILRSRRSGPRKSTHAPPMHRRRGLIRRTRPAEHATGYRARTGMASHITRFT